ncbi:DNA-3-methyladenine glycosylase 2 family protein [Bacillaceae bacterium SIJ1]|uniref:DNA-3-methyladenine glycosylase family protein n=1 Tax=Litoribacterium kuwaitense TaxID=1398745 RepID=UPI0013E9A634|nr:DNA-3-methyladenine glycosylase 2 family protein [Litoribacterium kuwaitense]NGP46030.1 DNA-3-methyladenine glycosylase 2 family protein [Litoribacterium kuwaitense]
MVEVYVNKPYRFDETIRSLQKDPLFKVEEKRVYIPFEWKKEKHVVTVEPQKETTDQYVFKVGVAENIEQEAKDHITFILDMKRPLGEMKQHYENTLLATVFETYEGTPLVRDASIYYCLMKTLIHQQLNMAFARTLTERFIHHFGEQKEGIWFMPSPERIASLEYSALRELQFSQRKAEYVIDLSRDIVDGRLDLAALASQSDEEVVKTLVAYRGVGVWTARSVLMSGLGRPDLFPSADIGLMKALHPLVGTEKRPTAKDLEVWSSYWSPYRSYAAIYLWKTIESNAKS